jgi:hypothetical protein
MAEPCWGPVRPSATAQRGSEMKAAGVSPERAAKILYSAHTVSAEPPRTHGVSSGAGP